MAPRNFTLNFGGGGGSSSNNNNIISNLSIACLPEDERDVAQTDVVDWEIYLRLALALAFFFCMVMMTGFLTMARSVRQLSNAMRYQRQYQVQDDFPDNENLRTLDVGFVDADRKTPDCLLAKLRTLLSGLWDRLMPWAAAFAGIFAGVPPTIPDPTIGVGGSCRRE